MGGQTIKSLFKTCIQCGEGYYTEPRYFNRKFCKDSCRLEYIQIHKKTAEQKRIENRLRAKKYYSTPRGNAIVRKHQKNERIKNYNRYYARILLNRAVGRGLVIKPKICPICESTERRIEAHHNDYTQPLIVSWLCSSCHADLHKRNRKP